MLIFYANITVFHLFRKIRVIISKKHFQKCVFTFILRKRTMIAAINPSPGSVPVCNQSSPLNKYISNLIHILNEKLLFTTESTNFSKIRSQITRFDDSFFRLVRAAVCASQLLTRYGADDCVTTLS